MKCLAVIAALVVAGGCTTQERAMLAAHVADPDEPTITWTALCDHIWVVADGWPEGTDMRFNLQAEDGFPPTVVGHWEFDQDTRFISHDGGYSFRFAFTLPSGEVRSFGGKSPDGCPPAESYPPDVLPSPDDDLLTP